MLEEYVKKRINFNFSGEKLFFDTSDELFSSVKIDSGTKVLLNSLRKNRKINYEKILDLGSGVGVIGIFLKKQNQGSEIYCSDRDSLSLEFTERNAALNSVEVNTISSLDYEKVSDKFDLIVCNFPAKLQGNGLKKFIYGASEKLNSKGIFALVIVKELEKEFREIVERRIKIVYEEKSAGYCVYHLNFLKEIIYEEDAYKKDFLNMNLGEEKYNLKTAESIPEFDSLHFKTVCLIDTLKEFSSENINKVSCLNPWQGALAIVCEKYLMPDRLRLVSRDLLSLKYSSENLKDNGFSNFENFHEDFNLQKEDFIVWNVCDVNFDLFFEKLKVMRKNSKGIFLGLKQSFVSRLEKKGFLLKNTHSVGGFVSGLVK